MPKCASTVWSYVLDTNIPSGRFVEAIPLLEEELEGPGSSPVNRLRGHPYIM